MSGYRRVMIYDQTGEMVSLEYVRNFNPASHPNGVKVRVQRDGENLKLFMEDNTDGD